MTIHAAKGLEFDTVFVAGMEADLLPHSRSIEQGDWAVEEERRLFYVAMTRAKRRLYLSHCDSRRKRGQCVETEPSPFLDELPPEYVEAMPREEYMSPDEAEAGFSRLKQRFGRE